MDKVIVEHWSGIGKANNELWKEYNKAIKLADTNGNVELGKVLRDALIETSVIDYKVLKAICDLQK